MSVASEEQLSYECNVCGLVYDINLGLPDEGIPAGTPWSDIPEDWVCPDCGAPKSAFEVI